MRTTIGARIRELRREQGMTQEDLGKKLGLKKATICKYEDNTISKFSRQRIEDLAKILNTSPAYLLGLESLSDKQANQVLTSFSAFQAKDIENYDLEGWQNPVTEGLSDEEKELLRIYSGLDTQKKNDLLHYAYSLEKED